MALEKNDHGLVIRALCDKLSEVELNELPPLVHQLLRLCSSHDGRLLLGKLQKYFAIKYSDGGSNGDMEEIGKV